MSLTGQGLRLVHSSTNKLVKEPLIGRFFFEQFEFLILDYLNKAVYISKNSFQ